MPSFEETRLYGESHLRTVRDGFRVLMTILKEWRRDRDAAEPVAMTPIGSA